MKTKPPATHTELPQDAAEFASVIWRSFHWSFFINVQALIICLQRFEQFIEQQQFREAEQELLCAAKLLTASAAAMSLASSFSKQAYMDKVRISMMPPAVQSDNFSGLMSWEHSALMQIWRRLRKIFNQLPTSLADAHKTFVQSYREMAINHCQVCEKFGGDDDGSIRFGERTGVETLTRFARNRSALIDPQQTIDGCPFSNRKP